MRIHFTMEDEDLELPHKVDKLIRTIVGGSESSAENLRELCRLIDLYRNFFGTSAKSSNNVTNADIVKKALS